MPTASPAPDQSRLTDFTEELQGAPFGIRQYLVMLSLGLLVLFDGMDTQMLGVVAHDLTRDLGLPISDFGVVFGAGLLGAMLGAIGLSPIADRWLGRKAMAVGAMAAAGLLTLATPLARDLSVLLVIRFAAGVALGGALPSIFALVGEFTPKRISRPVTTCLVAFMPLGSLLGGLLGRAIVPEHGWQMLLYVGGGLTLALTAFAAVILPESIFFVLNVRKQGERAVATARAYLDRSAIQALKPHEAVHEDRQPITKLFRGGVWKLTLLLWVAFIMNQGILYFVLSWTPALLQKSGLGGTAGMDAASMFGIGGALGTAAQGWFARKIDIYRLMLVEIALYLIAILSLPLILGNALLAPAMVFFIAFGICAYHSGFIVLVTESYQDDVRTTGFGWALGIGRIGATGAPVVAGALVAAGWSPGQVFAAAAVPAVVSAVALTAIAALLGERRATIAAHMRSEAAQPARRVPLAH